MGKWKIGVMKQTDRGLKKGDKVGVKVNDDLTKYFLMRNFVVFKPKTMEAAFYVKTAASFFVKLTGDATEGQEAKLEEEWPKMAKQFRKAWRKE